MNALAQIDQTNADGILTADALVARVQAYDPSADAKLIKRAYTTCRETHGEQKRHSGEPYYGHPVAVATLLTGLRMDTASICTALLHDVLEDTAMSETGMRTEFGDTITELVIGVTKLGQLELSSANLSKERQQAENFQKFVLAMSKDVRVLLVKLCDRLHNMRTLEHHPKQESRVRIARETIEIYAPLARKIGVESICTELEDLAFRYVNPSAWQSIDTRLKEWRESQKTAISQLSIMLRELLDKHGVKARVFGREKRPYAIWQKLQRQGINFEDVADIYAFRVIVEKTPTCYEILGLLHTNFRCVPARFRDFISVPKPNGYQSLHTTILGPDNQRVEVQIRTEEMNDVAERGIAAHWSYKDNSYAYDFATAGQDNPVQRLRPLVEMLEHGGEADEFFEMAKLEMFADQVFTFTPKGDLIALPQGATALDFAYAVHTDVGDTCIGAFINGREKPLRTPLQNGDVVKIVRGGVAEPYPGWESMVVTGKARSALRRLTRSSETEEFREIGRMLAEHAFVRDGQTFNESAVKNALPRLKFDNVDDVYIALGRGRLAVRDFMDTIFPARSQSRTKGDYLNRDLIDDNTARLYVKGEGLHEGISLHLGECCYPIPGDRIVGIQTPGKGLVIHTIDCETLASLEDEPERWVDLAWRKAAEKTASTGQIITTLEHVPGALAAITAIIGGVGGNVTNIKTLKRSPSFFDMVMDIEVKDNRHLSQIVAAMRASPYVVTVRRAQADLVKVEESKKA